MICFRLLNEGNILVLYFVIRCVRKINYHSAYLKSLSCIIFCCAQYITKNMRELFFYLSPNLYSAQLIQ